MNILILMQMKLIKYFAITLFIFVVFSGCAKQDENLSIAQTDVEAPSAPSGLAVQEAAGVINLSWTKNQESDISKYRLYRSTSAISNSPKFNPATVQKISFAEKGYIDETGTFFADSDIITGSTYYYRVSALDRNNNESNKSNQVAITYGDHITPAKPVGLTAQTGSKKGEINLSWTSNSESDFLSYNIYMADQGGSDFSFLASQSSNSYIVTARTAGKSYFFRITAVDNANNESESSNIVTCQAKGDNIAPAVPAGVSALPGTAGKINLSWSANTEPDLAKYRIYQLVGSGYSAINDITGTPLDTTYEVSGLTSSTYCYFKVSAVDDSDNESNLSAWARVIVP